MALLNESAPGGDQVRVSVSPKGLGERSNLGKAVKGGPQFGKRKNGLLGSPGKLSKTSSTLAEGVSKLRGKGALA